MLVSYCFVRYTRPRCIWLLTIFWLLVMNMLKQSTVQEMFLSDLHDLELYEVIVYFCWMVLRLVSFTLDFRHEHDRRAASTDRIHYSNVNYLGYVFYVPTMLHGPPMTYARYIHMLPLNKYQRVEDFLVRLSEMLKTLVRLAFWSFVYELSMHYIYANNVVYNSQVNCYPLPYSSLRSNWQIYNHSFSIHADGAYGQSLGAVRIRYCDWSIFLRQIHNCIRFGLGYCPIRAHQCAGAAKVRRTHTSVFEYVAFLRSGTARISASVHLPGHLCAKFVARKETIRKHHNIFVHLFVAWLLQIHFDLGDFEFFLLAGRTSG